jgi:plasmid stabilization system protein ParE
LIAYTPEAQRHVDQLLRHYELLQRPEAIRAFLTALDDAERRIARNPGAGLRAPRPYPRLARSGRAWLKAGRYWITYSTAQPPVIIGVFYESADIPNRI